MTYVRNQFRDPAGVVPDYDWQVNHSEEDQFGKSRTIEETAPTGHIGLVKQQGADQPMVLKLKGTILHHNQFVWMRQFFDLSRLQSVIFRDFAGDEYEVIVTEFNPVRKPTINNPRDPSIPLHYWTYDLTMEVLTVRSGMWHGEHP